MTVELVRPTKAGSAYIVTVQDDNGDKKFQNKLDVMEKDQSGNTLMGVFKAQ